MPVRRALATAAAITTVLALAGCGGADDKAADKSSATSSASDSSSPPGTTAGESGSSGESDAAGSGEEMSADEFVELLKDATDKATTAHVTMDLGTVGSAEGDADYTRTPPEMAIKLTVDALGGEVEVRLVDGFMYMKSPTLGDKWRSVPLDDPSSPLGALGGQLDVKKQIELFADAVTSATFEGTEDVDGESFDHYTATVDTKKVLQSLPSEAAGQADVPDSMTQEWWFDGDGLIRKFSSDLGATVMTLSGWGEDVTIEAPPSDEVTTMPDTGVSG